MPTGSYMYLWEWASFYAVLLALWIIGSQAGLYIAKIFESQVQPSILLLFGLVLWCFWSIS